MCRRLMTVPGVGPLVALTYRATVDVVACFWKAVGVTFGLTPSKDQSGDRDPTGRISRFSRSRQTILHGRHSRDV